MSRKDVDTKDKIRAICEHFGVEKKSVVDDTEEYPEWYSINFGHPQTKDNNVSIEVVHVTSDTFIDLGFDAFTKMIGNNYYYFRLC